MSLTQQLATSHLTEPKIGATASAWWDGNSDAVRAVFDLAWLRGNAGDEAFDRILTLLVPACADSIGDLAHILYRVERLDCGDLDAEVGGEANAENELSRLKADAVCVAQLVASLIAAGVR